jgi:hypothetical protein
MRSRYRDGLFAQAPRLPVSHRKSREEEIMLRKTLITLVSVGALGFGSTAMAMHGGGGGHGGGWGGGARSFGGAGFAGPRGGMGPMMMHGASMGPMTHAAPMNRAPMLGGRVQGWNGRTAWGHDQFHDRFHHRFHNRNSFAVGFGGPIYDYAYGSCWSWVPTPYGWRSVYVCGDYGYY